MLHKPHDHTCIATGTSILMFGSGFLLAASIQSGEHLRQHKAHHRDTQNATNSTLTTEKPQNNINTHPKWHPVGGTLGAPNPHTHQRAHLFAPPTGPFGMLLAPPLPSIAPQAHERTRVPTLDISEYMYRLAVVAVQAGICSASRRDAGHVSACSQATRAQNNIETHALRWQGRPEQIENEIQLNRATITQSENKSNNNCRGHAWWASKAGSTPKTQEAQ